jgi:aspartate kinase
MTMKIKVLKFGGSSVANTSLIKNIAKRIIELKEREKDCGIVVVVSAMGDTTDELLNLAFQITKEPNKRDLDMLLITGEFVSSALLSIAINSLGSKAIALNALQAKIFTDSLYTDANIIAVKPDRIIKELKSGKIVVVGGFQGITKKQDFTTLGRGGSDTTAVALAQALAATNCEIFTDVDGVYTADPRIVEDARKLEEISYEEMLEAASLGAKVLQPKAVELAQRYNIKLHVRSAFNETCGTIICNNKEVKNMQDKVVTQVVGSSKEARITILEVCDRPGVAACIFSALARENINVDMIIQSGTAKDRTNLSFTVAREDLKKTLQIAESIAKDIDAKGVVFDDKIAKVSIVGTGMRERPGVAATMFKALAEHNINIEMISTSEIKISCVIKEDKLKEAMKAIHKAFGLGKKECSKA